MAACLHLDDSKWVYPDLNNIEFWAVLGGIEKEIAGKETETREGKEQRGERKEERGEASCCRQGGASRAALPAGAPLRGAPARIPGTAPGLPARHHPTTPKHNVNRSLRTPPSVCHPPEPDRHQNSSRYCQNSLLPGGGGCKNTEFFITHGGVLGGLSSRTFQNRDFH